MSAVSAAEAALDRRAAVASLAGAQLGRLPLLWLIREALDDYDYMLDGLGGEVRLRAVKQRGAVRLLDAVGHTFLLTPDNGSRVVEERDAAWSVVRSHEVPNAALILHDAVKDDPVAAENLLTTIEYATKAASP